MIRVLYGKGLLYDEGYLYDKGKMIRGLRMERKKLFNIFSFVINLFIVISVTWSVAFYFYYEDGSGNMLAHGTECFRFFTIDSNILMAIASAIYLYFNIVRMTGKEIVTPTWLKVFKFVATCAIMVTFFVVLIFLIPVAAITEGIAPWFFYERNCLILHLLAPLAAFLSLVLFDKEDQIDRKYINYHFAPVVLYGIVYFTCVVVFGVWPDFYSFTFNGRYYLAPIAAALVLGVSYGASELSYFIQKLCIKKYN